MNRQSKNSSCEVTSSDAMGARACRVGRSRRLESLSGFGLMRWFGSLRQYAPLCGFGPVGQHGPSRACVQQRWVGPPVFLTACCWFWLDRLRKLGLFVMVCGWAAEEIELPIAGQVRKLCLGKIGRSCQYRMMAVRASVGGLHVSSSMPGQALRNRELGQLCQTQKWLKRYKTGMFANLANLANVFSPNRRPVAGRWLNPVLVGQVL